MAGKKKAGDLVRPIGVRLDRHIDALVRSIAERSAVVGNEPAAVVRVIVTAFLMERKDPIAEFDSVALAVNAWRKSYAEGLAEGAGRAAGPERETRRKDREKRG